MNPDTQELLAQLCTSRIRRDRSGGLSITIPLGLEQQVHLEPGLEVEWQIDGDRLILQPRQPKHYSLEELVAGITPENRHEYIDTGSPVGQEAW